MDDAGLVSARRWCWRQSLASAASAATTEVLITEGHHEGAEAEVAEALADLDALIAAHVRGASVRRAQLSASGPAD